MPAPIISAAIPTSTTPRSAPRPRSPRASERVAILDVDYHHGNGTQDIFAGRGDVAFASIHADPATDYPFFWGHADESERQSILNLPLPRGTDWAATRPR